MTPLQRCIAFSLLVTLLLAGWAGCGSSSRSPEAAWRDEVDASLQNLREQEAYRYRSHLETWIGVSGQSIYGDEKGEGSFLNRDLSVTILRTSPAGEESLVLSSLDGEFYLEEGGAWSAVTPAEIPSPLYDPESFCELVSSYGSITLEGEEEYEGITCRRYLLQLGSDEAEKALSRGAWSYFSSLDHELNCRVLIGDASASPASLRLEVTGFDPQENLQRYRMIFTMHPYDFDAGDIQLVGPRQEG